MLVERFLDDEEVVKAVVHKNTDNRFPHCKHYTGQGRNTAAYAARQVARSERRLHSGGTHAQKAIPMSATQEQSEMNFLNARRPGRIHRTFLHGLYGG